MMGFATLYPSYACYQTSCNQVFVAGDRQRGQLLVVWAIREGRQRARAVDEFLIGRVGFGGVGG